MQKNIRRRRFYRGVWLAAALSLSVAAAALSPVSTGWLSDLAVQGYDTVAYFEQGQPLEGDSRYETVWNGATWRFSSGENLDKFLADPEKYAPQYGGYCAWAVAQGNTAPIDPQAWRIVDGKLYLNYDAKIQTRWENDISGHIERADRNWPELLKD